MTRRVSALFVGWALTFGASSVLAQPSLFRRVAEPRARAEAKLLASLERMVDEARQEGFVELGLGREFARAAVAMIELTGIDEPLDPRLACAEARALLDAEVGREADARRLLERALERLPPGTRAASAWNTLGMVLARLADKRAEKHAYSKVIELAWDPEMRALAYYNRGEAHMFEHELVAARSDYEQAISGARDPSVVARARYGLAVAEERLGDLPAAYAALDRALAVTLPVPPFPNDDPLDLPSVFFLPAYEENYVRALRAMAVGRRATEAAERRDAYEAAVAEWDTYLARAADTEPFRDNARAHRARAERALEQAREVERRGPARPATARRPPATNP
jgi:tetratricopeptide (TPR) repeat protein